MDDKTRKIGIVICDIILIITPFIMLFLMLTGELCITGSYAVGTYVENGTPIMKEMPERCARGVFQFMELKKEVIEEIYSRITNETTLRYNETDLPFLDVSWFSSNSSSVSSSSDS